VSSFLDQDSSVNSSADKPLSREKRAAISRLSEAEEADSPSPSPSILSPEAPARRKGKQEAATRLAGSLEEAASSPSGNAPEAPEEADPPSPSPSILSPETKGKQDAPAAIHRAARAPASMSPKQAPVRRQPAADDEAAADDNADLTEASQG
jgi:hypothetical protein